MTCDFIMPHITPRITPRHLKRIERDEDRANVRIDAVRGVPLCGGVIVISWWHHGGPARAFMRSAAQPSK